MVSSGRASVLTACPSRSGVGSRGRARLSSSFSTCLAITSTSRLTGSPGPLAPSVVSARVVGIRLISNQSSPTALTVSETPSTVIEPFSTT